MISKLTVAKDNSPQDKMDFAESYYGDLRPNSLWANRICCLNATG